MTLTSHRIIQYLIILLILTLGGGGYWYWKNAQAAVTQKAASKTGLSATGRSTRGAARAPAMPPATVTLAPSPMARRGPLASWGRE
jgi:hypothetical protein